MATSSTSYNGTTNKIEVTYDLSGVTSAYLCWSDTATTDYTSLVTYDHYTAVYNESGTWSDDTVVASGSSRYYYLVNIYDYSLITSCSYTAAANSTLTITDFTAEVVTGGVQCQFTAPAGISNSSTVQWQRTTTDPDSGTPVWTTVATTDLNGNAVTE